MGIRYLVHALGYVCFYLHIQLYERHQVEGVCIHDDVCGYLDEATLRNIKDDMDFGTLVDVIIKNGKLSQCCKCVLHNRKDLHSQQKQ